MLPCSILLVTCSDMPTHNPMPDAMVREVAAQKPDSVAILGGVMKLVIASEADPYLLVGPLVERTASSMLQRIPEERRAATEVGRGCTL